MAELQMLRIDEEQRIVKTHPVSHLFTERTTTRDNLSDANDLQQSNYGRMKLLLNRRVTSENREDLMSLIEVKLLAGKSQYEKGNYWNAMQYFSEALEDGIQLKNDYHVARCHIEIGLCCYHLNMFTQATYHSRKALIPLWEQWIEDEEIKCHAYYIDILCYHKIKNSSKLREALSCFQSAKNIPEAYLQRVKLIEIELLLNTGEAEASRLLEDFQHLTKRNTGYQSAYEDASRDFFHGVNGISYLVTASKLYQRLEQWEQAINLLKEAEAMAETQGVVSEFIEIYSLLGELYLEAGNLEAGKAYFNKIRRIK